MFYKDSMVAVGDLGLGDVIRVSGRNVRVFKLSQRWNNTYTVWLQDMEDETAIVPFRGLPRNARVVLVACNYKRR